jgi:hypothetical protein
VSVKQAVHEVELAHREDGLNTMLSRLRSRARLSRAQRHHIQAGSQRLGAIGQVLRGPLPIRYQFHMAVGRHGCALFAVGQLQFNDIAAEAVLAPQGRGRSARPMRDEVGNAEVDALEEVVQRHVAHRHAATEDRREDVLAMPRQFVHLAQDLDGLG